MTWAESYRADPSANRMAKRHYTCQTPDSDQFVPPGPCLVLAQPGALWVTSWPKAEYTHHAWPGAWRITRRRDRSDVERIRVCMVTFVDERKTLAKRDPGRCFRRAGFVEIGRTKDKDLLALGFPVDALPPPREPLGVQQCLALGAP